METEKRISTFTADEKEAMQKIEKFEADMEEQLNEEESISSIEYYEKLKITEKLEINANVYIATINQEDGTQRIGIYAENSNNLIGFVNEDGTIEFIDPLLRSLELELTLDDLKELNVENLKVKSEELTPEELEEYLKGQEEKSESEKDEDEKEVEDDSEEEINEELIEQEGEDLEISMYKKVKDPRIKTEFTELQGKGEIGLAYSKKLGQFVMLEKTTQGFKRLDEIQPAKPTMRTIISIDETGEKVERKSPHALMKTNRDNMEMSITIDTYGYVELGKVNVTPCNERVTRPIEMQGKTEEPEYDVMRATDTNRENDEIAHTFKKGEEKGREVQTLELIKLEDGSTTTIEKEAQKAEMNVGEFWEIYSELEEGAPWERLKTAHLIVKEAAKDKVSPKEFLKEYKQAEGATTEERISNAHEEIEEQFRNPGSRR